MVPERGYVRFPSAFVLYVAYSIKELQTRPDFRRWQVLQSLLGC